MGLSHPLANQFSIRYGSQFLLYSAPLRALFHGSDTRPVFHCFGQFRVPEPASTHRSGRNFGQCILTDDRMPKTLVNTIQWWFKDLYGTISKGGAGQFSPVPAQLLELYGAAPKAAPSGGKQPATDKSRVKHNDMSKNMRETWGATTTPIIKWGSAASDSDKKNLKNFWRDANTENWWD